MPTVRQLHTLVYNRRVLPYIVGGTCICRPPHAHPSPFPPPPLFPIPTLLTCVYDGQVYAPRHYVAYYAPHQLLRITSFILTVSSNRESPDDFVCRFKTHPGTWAQFFGTHYVDFYMFWWLFMSGPFLEIYWPNYVRTSVKESKCKSVWWVRVSKSEWWEWVSVRAKE